MTESFFKIFKNIPAFFCDASDAATPDPANPEGLMKMDDTIMHTLDDWGLSKLSGTYLDDVIIFALVLLAALVAYKIAKGMLSKLVSKLAKHTKTRFDDLIAERKIVSKFTSVVPAIVLFLFLPAALPRSEFEFMSPFLERLCMAYIIAVGLRFASGCLGVLHDVSQRRETRKNKPLKGLIQSLHIAIWVVGIVLIIGVLLRKDPMHLLAGIGASAAILLVVFKDAIMSFVAGIQLSSDDMLRVGDWITMPKYDADGDVIEVNLNAVKVRNFDNTITTIPPYALVSESFQNWRGMAESGGRRVKRSVAIDMNSIKFCDEEMLGRFRKIALLKEYIDKKDEELKAYNAEHGIDASVSVNVMRLTNIGVFRAYVEAYLKTHPQVNKSHTCMVRQLQPSDEGIPLELYFFTSDVRWIPYENIQSDVFDHVIASLPHFGLRPFQGISPEDLHGAAPPQD